MPRSSAGRQPARRCRTISVALLDHGEIVPIRGMTSKCGTARRRKGEPGHTRAAPRVPGALRTRGAIGIHDSEMNGRSSPATRRDRLQPCAAACRDGNRKEPVDPVSQSLRFKTAPGRADPGKPISYSAESPRAPGDVHGHGELGDIAPLDLADLADALFLDLVDAQDCVHRDIGAPYAGKLRLDALLARDPARRYCVRRKRAFRSRQSRIDPPWETDRA